MQALSYSGLNQVDSEWAQVVSPNINRAVGKHFTVSGRLSAIKPSCRGVTWRLFPSHQIAEGHCRLTSELGKSRIQCCGVEGCETAESTSVAPNAL